MFKTIAALILAGLLAVMAYGIFWLVCLNYTTGQMREAMREALRADMTYGTAQWVPDPAHVTMDLPNTKLVMTDGPVREVRLSELRLISSFLMRDRWTAVLPNRVEVMLTTGKVLLLETEKGEVSWLRDGGRLTLRAAKVRILDLNGREMLQLGDVVLDQKLSDSAVRVNLASRPQMEGGEGIVSGQLEMPARAVSNVFNLFGRDSLPTLGMILGSIAEDLKRGGELKMENVSFKLPNGGASGAVFGTIRVLADGRTTGTMLVSGDSAERMFNWLQTAEVMWPRNETEIRGMTRFGNGLEKAKGRVRLENMQDTLMLNGNPVGPLPVLPDVVAKLWN